MKARFFYAPPIFNTYPKLYVLTSDGEFYSEVRTKGRITMEIEHTDYETFDESRFASDDYPLLLEIDYKEASTMPLKDHPNWINGYLERKNIAIPHEKVAMSA